ncbi:MAG: hypothetical protein LIO45_03260 [Clostridiales bacterium]|nr:hypothetical protein [Clostridiales bacterium]
MKRLISLCALLSLLLGLCACTAAPTETNDGLDWSENWVRVGATLGVEPPENGLTLLDNKDALAGSDLYYAAWTVGEAEDYVNSDGDTVDLYDAQLYLLLADCADEETAAQNIAQWQAAEEAVYTVTDTQTVTCAGQEFTVLIYDGTGEDNPYQFGASAFGVYQNHAINVELTCQTDFDGDALTILTDFLDGIHYAS